MSATVRCKKLQFQLGEGILLNLAPFAFNYLDPSNPDIPH